MFVTYYFFNLANIYIHFMFMIIYNVIKCVFKPINKLLIIMIKLV